MNVLLILGNGFDLNLGLPTAYSHFYQYYLKEGSYSMQGKFLKESLYNWKNYSDTNENEIIDWVDLELALGKVSEKYNSPKDYLADIDHISEELTKYLRAVEQLPIRSLEKVAKHFIDDVLKVSLLTEISQFSDDNKTNAAHDFVGYFDPNPTKGLRSFLNNSTFNQSFLKLDIMTFNYTNIVERIFEELKRNDSFSKKISLGSILHVHQDLGEEGVILGVDSVNQITNSAFHSTYSIFNGIVKPNLLKEYASGIDTQCISTIEEADVIILFGVSMGLSDASWWRNLGRIVKGNGKRIIYCPYESPEDFVYTSRAIVSRIHNLILFFLNKLDLSVSQYDEMYSKVYPVRKNQMFNFGIYNDLKIAQEKYLKLVIDSLLKSKL